MGNNGNTDSSALSHGLSVFIQRYGLSGLAVLGVLGLGLQNYFLPSDQALFRKDLMSQIAVITEENNVLRERVRVLENMNRELRFDMHRLEMELITIRQNTNGLHKSGVLVPDISNEDLSEVLPPPEVPQNK